MIFRRRLPEAEEAHGATPINNCTPGTVVTVRGRITSVSASSPHLEVDVADASGLVRVIWLGRRTIAGVQAGRPIVVWGRLTCGTTPTIFNPRYTLEPWEPVDV